MNTNSKLLSRPSNLWKASLQSIIMLIMMTIVALRANSQRVTMPRVAETQTITAQIALAPGVIGLPIMAVLVNNTNFADATWVPFATNLPVNLGGGDGPRDVWFGFHDESGAEFFVYRKVILDTASLSLSLFTPLANLVTTPYLQVKGYCTKPLQRISYDLVNTNGTFADQDAYITRQEFNPNTRAFGTNHFQCFDVPLASGTNTISIKAVDMKSNQWVSTFSVTLDTTQLTNPPAVNLLWPTDGASIAADSVTLRGSVADGNLLVSAIVTDDSGNTQAVDGLVERDGAFWIDDLPLTGSTNSVTITVTDPAGNVSSRRACI